MAVTPRPLAASRSWSAQRRGSSTRADSTRLRILWLLAIAMLLASTIWVRLAYWQVLQHQWLSQLAAAYHVATITLPAVRGEIYDRDLRPLAVNTAVYDVTLAPTEVGPPDRDRVADGLASVLGRPRQDVMGLLRSGRSFAYVKKRQPKEVADRLLAMNLPGVHLDPQQDRTHFQGGTPDVSLASSLLGFVNYAGRGQWGVEQWYDQRLAGRSGWVVTYRDSLGQEIALGNQRSKNKVDGQDLVLTLDSSVQYAAEQAIADGVKANRAASGSVIVLDSKTGEVAAWANYPAYDASQFATADPASFKDPIVSDLYEPGSVMKVVTLAGAIDQGRITPGTTIQDPGYVVVAGSTLRDWDRRAHGTVTMTNVLENSLNVGAVRAEQAEGSDAFLHYLDAFGLGRPSGVDVAGETQPKLSAQWRPTELATTSYGQGIAVDMVQMAAAINVIANGGRWVAPHVVARVGGAVPAVPAPRQVVSSQTAATMTQMMESVVQNGSGYKARVAGFEQDEAGKTGTSQIPDPQHGGYYDDRVWASYAGFLPADNPRFTMLVVIRAPNNGSYDANDGYIVAAPVWKRIAEQIVPQWRITPEAVSPSN
jgi:cell division protein FtsI/penicillin-binding protein 2